ncbi:lytic transglycosylase domain-containing protein [Pannonibacter phragmitetus]|uniref:lytic transglycosylase domain-containing protein n=1 Tax=Pannonibacter phragmitetus TaxID=121719 RepID=UPI000B979332|nr:lytic transglycosylase domain-containing protein [Pannonibacter phragmitetus]
MPRSSLHRKDQRCGNPCRIVLLLLSGLTVAATPSLAALAQQAPLAAPVPHDPFAAHIAEAAARFELPEHWIAAVLQAESAGDPRAVSRAGAMGLMQVMPDTWAELRARHRLGSDPFDTRDNIHAGAAYLREMLDRYGNVGAMLAAYNAGPGRYDEYLASGRILPAETRAYVAALAPILGAEPLSFSAAAAPSAPPDWRAAPLFVRPSGDGFDAAPAPDPAPSIVRPGAHAGNGVDPVSVEASGLFVPHSSAGDTP